jgi:K+-dependent Na+/Ca+ exchanger-like protein
MAIGSSAPELAVALIAMFVSGNHEAIGIGTIVGSSLFNALVIVGYALFVGTNVIRVWSPIYRDLLFYLVSVVLLYIFFRNGSVNIIEASVLLLIYLVYILILLRWSKWFRHEDTEKPGEKPKRASAKSYGTKAVPGFISRIRDRYYPFFERNLILSFFISVGFITLLSWILVQVAIYISLELRVHELVIGLTVIAIGTSVPDFISSGIVAKRGRTGMAINNSIGSNVFDILIGLGLPIFLLTLITGSAAMVENERLTNSFALLVGSILLLVAIKFILKEKRKRVIGLFLIALYIMYLVYEIFLNI